MRRWRLYWRGEATWTRQGPIHDIIYSGRDATRLSGDSVRPQVLMAPRTTLPISTSIQKNFQTLT